MNLDEELGFYVLEGLQRKQSIPGENNLRRMISQQVCCEIANLQFDVKIALMILESYDDEEFTENSQARILNEVVEVLLDRSPRASVISSRSHLRSNLSIKESLISQECVICYALMAEDESQRLDCDHVFCMECLKEYLVQRIMNGHSDNMVCPQEDCDEMIPDIMISKIIDEQLYTKMNKFRQLKKLAHDQSLRQCPRPDCDEFLNITEEQCKCGQLICAKCGQVEHAGLSCYEQSDKEFQKAVKKLKIFKCKKCKAPIQKNDGCNHMTCYQCGYEFCWLCRSRYSGKHYDAYYILGCPGMQFAQRDPFRYPNFYRFLIILALIVLGPPIAVLALVLGFVGLVLGLPVIAYMNCVSSERFNSMQTCYQVIHIILMTIACIVLSPLSLCLVCLGLVAGVIIGIPYGIYMIIDYLRN